MIICCCCYVVVVVIYVVVVVGGGGVVFEEEVIEVMPNTVTFGPIRSLFITIATLSSQTKWSPFWPLVA